MGYVFDRQSNSADPSIPVAPGPTGVGTLLEHQDTLSTVENTRQEASAFPKSWSCSMWSHLSSYSVETQAGATIHEL